jgi:S-adenosylmethionine:tRNA ribosyltransferase-isomerase
MKTNEFCFDLPNHLIAQYPPEKRGQSRLMTLDRLTGKIGHRMVEDLPEILSRPEFCGKDGEMPLLVFNNSKVRKARLIGKSLETGAQVEFLLLDKLGSGEWGVGSGGKKGTRDRGSGIGDRYSDNDINSKIYSDNSDNNPYSPLPTPHSLTWKVLVQRSKRRKTGSRYAFYDETGAEIARAEITGNERAAQAAQEFRLLEFDRIIDDTWLDLHGHIPLPPYIKRQDVPEDADRYQTVYASVFGSSAAPTAGLHFTREMMDSLAATGIDTAFITLHVGLGTFLPVRSTNIEDHIMHSETFTIDEQTATKIETAKAQGRKIIAIGTTTVRTLESAYNSSHCSFFNGSTSIFIYPGYQFKIIDALFTNFHTPESTLLMLVSAFAGRDRLLESYAEAIGKGYRFFSYGDAMLIS